MGFGYGMGFGAIGAGSALISLLAVAIIVVAVVHGVAEWSRNNDSPRLTVPATLVSRRTSVTHHHHHNASGAHHVHPVTHYYVTFEVESGDRMEFSVSGREYGVLTEGDRGQLSFQGTRYLGFERMVDPT